MVQQREIINIGALPNDGQGDPLRVAFQKINNNFSSLFSTDSFKSEAYSVGLSLGQIIWEYPVELFTHADFQIDTVNPETQDMQNIVITAAIHSNNSGVKWTGHSTIFAGNVCTQYDMDVQDSNVRILANPLQNSTLLHFITAQVTVFTGEQAPGLPIRPDGYQLDSQLATENGLTLVTDGTIS